MAVIRISGYPGSGKTTLSKHLSEFLGYGYHYTGGIFRDMAKEKSLSIEEFYKYISADPAAEKSVDDRQAEIMQTEDNILVEGRIAPFQKSPFQTINILLTVSPEEGARRQLLRSENAHRSLGEMLSETEERLKNEREHYRTLYGIPNHFDEKKFDIVVDTTNLKPDDVFKEVQKRLRRFLEI